MRRKSRTVSGRLLLATVLAASPAARHLAAQTTASISKPTPWTVPRTPEGQPDLQGVWANNVATPLERPAELAGKPTLSNTEMARLQAAAAKVFSGTGDAAFGDQVYDAVVKAAFSDLKSFTSTDGQTGDYNQFWLPDRYFENRTSLITDPADGRLPPLTPEAAARDRRSLNPFALVKADSWEDRGLSERCITFGSPQLLAGYNSYYQIVQSRDAVAIVMETIHDTRIVPLDGRPHVGPGIREWLGDSRGHFEGDTLVVETLNYSPKSPFMGATEHVHITERFTRTAPDTLEYRVTVDDPRTWTRPWTAMIPLKHTEEKLYEYACHEDNIGLAGILAGARAEEQAARHTSPKGSE